MKRLTEWCGKWLEKWKRRQELPGEYEALAREFATLTARCLEAEEQRNRNRAKLIEANGRILRLERDVSAITGDVPGLTPGEIERLAILAEECGEVARSVGKILRYGWESTSPFSTAGRTNRGALEREIGSVRSIVNLMVDAGDVRMAELQGWQKSKRMKLAKWTLYQECSMPREAQLEMMRSIASDRE